MLTFPLASSFECSSSTLESCPCWSNEESTTIDHKIWQQQSHQNSHKNTPTREQISVTISYIFNHQKYITTPYNMGH